MLYVNDRIRIEEIEYIRVDGIYSNQDYRIFLEEMNKMNVHHRM
jgi:hypothetical protein